MTITPRRGAVVSTLTRRDFLEAYQVREALEVMAVRLAVQPSGCSGFGYRAVSRYGLWTGGRLALGRVLRCRPGVTPGTRDRVPGPRGDR